MLIELSPEELATLRESLEYSKMQVQDAQDTPYVVRQENIARFDAVLAKLRDPEDMP